MEEYLVVSRLSGTEYRFIHSPPRDWLAKLDFLRSFVAISYVINVVAMSLLSAKLSNEMIIISRRLY